MSEETRKIVPIPLSELLVNEKFNCRGNIAPLDVISLAQSIEAQGLQSPVLAAELTPRELLQYPGKKWKLIGGFRRTKAHEVLKRTTIDAIVRPPMTDIEARLVNLTENLERSQLNILQEAKAISVLADLGLKREDIAQKVGQSIGWVQVRLMLLDLPEDIQQEAAAGILGQHNIRDLYAIRHNTSEMYEAVKTIKNLKEKGQKAVRIRPKNEPIDKKRRRDPSEVYKLICHVLENLGPCLATRVLAWQNGEITDIDIFQEIKKECQQQGKAYIIPSTAIANMQQE